MEHILSFSDIMILSFSSVLAGFLLLIKGGGWTVDSAVYVAHKLDISPLLIGFTVIAFGTSLPELVVSINANLKGFPGLSLGNVVGSNIANILLVVGMAALVAPIAFKKTKGAVQDFIMLAGASILLSFLVQQEEITKLFGGMMVGVLILYVYFQYRQALKSHKQETLDQDDLKKFPSLLKAVLFLVVGLVGIVLGAEILVRGAVVGATALGVPELVIGMTIVAFGTSLPEIVTSVIAGLKGKSDIVIGNVVGSCVFNILSIVGLTAFFSSINLSSIPDRLAHIDVWVMLIVSVIFSLYMLIMGRVRKLEGVVLIIAYGVFIFDQYFSTLS